MAGSTDRVVYRPARVVVAGAGAWGDAVVHNLRSRAARGIRGVRLPGVAHAARSSQRADSHEHRPPKARGRASSGAKAIARKVAGSGVDWLWLVGDPSDASAEAQMLAAGSARVEVLSAALVPASPDGELPCDPASLGVDAVFSVQHRERDGVAALEIIERLAWILREPGMVNIDAADVRTVLSDAGHVQWGLGAARGDQRATRAASIACTAASLRSGRPLHAARRLLLHVAAPAGVSLQELDAVCACVRAQTDEQAQLLWGWSESTAADDLIRVTLVAAGLRERRAVAPMSV